MCVYLEVVALFSRIGELNSEIRGFTLQIFLASGQRFVGRKLRFVFAVGVPEFRMKLFIQLVEFGRFLV